MPTYTFKNKETEEIFEQFLKMSEHSEFMLKNPHLEMYIANAPVLCDPTRLSATRKFDTGFKEVLERVHARTPGSTLNKSSSQL